MTAIDPPPPAPTPAADRSQPTLKPMRWWLAKSIPGLGVILAGVLCIVGLGMAQRMGWIAAGGGTGSPQADASGTGHTCSMHPQIRQPAPGRCPICGMALVPAALANSTAKLDTLAVQIDPAQRRLAQIQTAPVERGAIEITLHSVGAIAIDESRQATIAAYIDGRLERLFADYTGVDIKEGDHLAVIYSPPLFAAQVEY